VPGRLSFFRICRVTGICFQSAGGPAHSKTFRDLRGRVEHAPVFGVRQFSAAFPSREKVGNGIKTFTRMKGHCKFRDLRGRVEHAPVFVVRQFSAAFRSQDEVDKIELRLSLD